jgi:hypothetical protein
MFSTACRKTALMPIVGAPKIGALFIHDRHGSVRQQDAVRDGAA